jgi:hypothetical protein
MTQYIPILGAAVWLIGALFYAKDTVIGGTTKPNRVSWLMWAIAPLIAAAASYADGVRFAALPVFVAGFGSLLIFVATFLNPKSYWKLETVDYIYGALSGLSLVLWWLTKEPVIAIIFSILSDAFASIPTVIKSWKHPKTESGVLYISALFNVLTCFFALKTFGISELAFPIYLVGLNVILITGIYRGRLKKL